jgi:adenylate kinase
MNIVLNGASGSGKGSMARLIAQDFLLVHISTGDIFRRNIADQTALGKRVNEYVSAGRWVPDALTVEVLLDRIMQRDCQNGVIFDGYPRTLNQAKTLDEHIDIDLVISIDVSEDVVLTRLSGRYMCKKCNAIHAARWDKLDKCKVCGGELYQREDDRSEVIKKRLENFKINNAEILKYYKKQGKLFVIHDKMEYSPEDTYRLCYEAIVACSDK